LISSVQNFVETVIETFRRRFILPEFFSPVKLKTIDSRKKVLYSEEMEIESGAKCHFCDICDGHGCIAELPGMGGAYANENFVSNCSAWAEYHNSGTELPGIRLAPITGALQNVGYHEERAFYFDIIQASVRAGIRLSIGDGYPDEKLKYGIEALQAAGKKGAVFIKPYENHRIIERMEWAEEVSEIIGVDIDSYAILTMRNLVNLQKKTAADLLELKNHANRPFAVKGVFRLEDIELVKEVRPDIVVVSNHGGRVETDKGSTAAFLARYGKELSRYAGQVWVDGGIRSYRDLAAARNLGAVEVMVGRPFITALLRSGLQGIPLRVQKMMERPKTL
jgi:isopentenyl diphosphate isomerase/L-lactate dehydrogenase-like FMN-dependent dehydrogenase